MLPFASTPGHISLLHSGQENKFQQEQSCESEGRAHQESVGLDGDPRARPHEAGRPWERIGSGFPSPGSGGEPHPPGRGLRRDLAGHRSPLPAQASVHSRPSPLTWNRGLCSPFGLQSPRGRQLIARDAPSRSWHPTHVQRQEGQQSLMEYRAVQKPVQSSGWGGGEGGMWEAAS